MKILSDNILDYIKYNYNINEINDISDLDKVEELTINLYNSSLEIEPFYPEDLTHFHNLRRISFINFEINNQIVESINKINLTELSLDNCTSTFNNTLYIYSLYVNNSNINYKNISGIKELTILGNDNLDVNDFINNGLDELTLLNCNIKNCNLLMSLNNCIITFKGCDFDDISIVEQDNVYFDPEEYKEID